MDYGTHPQHWLLFDRLVQQIVLQSGQEDPDLTVMNLNVQDLVQQYVKIALFLKFYAVRVSAILILFSTRILRSSNKSF